MKKILDFVLIFLLAFFTIQLLNPADKKIEEKPETKIVFSSSSYTIPASVKLDITNNSTGAIALNTCKDFKITSQSTNIALDKKDCKDVKVGTGEKVQIDLSSSYKSFLKTGDYVLSVKIDKVDYVSTFKIENKGDISKIFSSLIYAPVYNLLIFLLYILNSSLGWSIIAITILIRILLLWPQHKMMVSQKRLQAIQPKIKEIQEKYKGNNQILGMKMMELYKTEKVNPMGSCGFMLIQMPILLVIYNIILNIKDESHYYYIYSVLQKFDISTIAYNFYGLDLLGIGGVAGVVLGVLVAFVQFIQIKLSIANNAKNNSGVVLEKKKDANDYSAMMPDADTLNKFMLYVMPIMVGVFTYMFPAGLGIYWLITTVFMIAQQLIVNNIIKK